MSQYYVLLPPMAYIGGIIVQCLSLLRKRPSKWAVTLFVFMIVYMAGMMTFAVSQRGTGAAAPSPASIIPLVMTFGMVIAFIFIAVFLKETVKIIDETVIVSNTLSYLFLILESWSFLRVSTLAAAIVTGLIMGLVSLRLILNRAPVRRFHRYLLYGWYLLVNGFFAVSFFAGLGLDFHRLPHLVNSGQVPIQSMFILGMIAVHVLFNFGVLYYSIIFSLFSRETRRNLIGYTETLFGDVQAGPGDMKRLLVAQAGIFLLVEVLFSGFSFEVVALWMLLTPLITRAFSIYSRRAKTG